LLTVVLCEVVPVDDDEVCQICKDMVGQARDTLESNETQVTGGSYYITVLSLYAPFCKWFVKLKGLGHKMHDILKANTIQSVYPVEMLIFFLLFLSHLAKEK